MVIVALVAGGCSATSTAAPVENEPTTLNRIDRPDSEPTSAPAATATPEPPAFADPGFCQASGNVLLHATALDLIAPESNVEMNQIALANLAEWLERSTLQDDPRVADRLALQTAFDEIASAVSRDHNYDWQAFQATTAAQSSAARIFDTQLADIADFLDGSCETPSSEDVALGAQERAAELIADFSIAPSTVVESDSLPGQSIFTHSSGRLVASFPSAWTWEEPRTESLVEFVASPDIDRFRAGDVIDGVRLELREVTLLADFTTMMEATATATTCVRTGEELEQGLRLTLTYLYDCGDHSGAIVGQFSEARGLGLIIEASFDGETPSRADLIRLGSIANSALWF